MSGIMTLIDEYRGDNTDFKRRLFGDRLLELYNEDLIYRDKIERENRKLREMLAALQWSERVLDFSSEFFGKKYCAWCRGVSETGHLPGCPLAALLKEEK